MNSADEKEIQEYTKNLGIEYRFGCYSEKNPDGTYEQIFDLGKLGV
jgi:hypothetical protein